LSEGVIFRRGRWNRHAVQRAGRLGVWQARLTQRGSCPRQVRLSGPGPRPVRHRPRRHSVCFRPTPWGRRWNPAEGAM